MEKYRTSSFVCLKIVSIILVSFASLNNCNGQESNHFTESKTLYETISRLDSVLFNAFNTRNLDTIKTLFSNDLEFYHDLGGLTRYNQNMDSFKRTFESDRKLRGACFWKFKVYPIKDFGAVEIGIHRFYSTEKGQKEQLSSEAKFIHLWHKMDGKWKISRIISFGHQEYL
ncbi:MAG: nuclear transport factor 2 family protein [Bacteroidales bacterium]|nr:nuclear transport factor 2 family protein [Bacteroidales bacterium]